MSNQLSELMHSLLGSEIQHYRHSAWRPPADVYRYENGWLVKLEVAGVRADDIQLCVAGHSLTIHGVRRDWSIRDGHQSYSMEIAYSRFEKAIELPCDIEGAGISTEYHDGMLLIRLQTGSATG